MFGRGFQLGCLVMLVTLAVFLQFVPRADSLVLYEGRAISFAMTRESLWAGITVIPSNPSARETHWHMPGIRVDGSSTGMWTPGGDFIAGWEVEISILWIALFLAIPPAIWAFRFRKTALRWLSGERPCPKCGYDLRATPDRCPECGKPVASKVLQ